MPDRNTVQQQGELTGVELHADSAGLGEPFKGRTMAGTIRKTPSFLLVIVLSREATVLVLVIERGDDGRRSLGNGRLGWAAESIRSTACAEHEYRCAEHD